MSRILSTGEGGGVHPLGRHPPGLTPTPRQTPPPQQTASEADGTHPTGMHSCSVSVSTFVMKEINLEAKILSGKKDETAC